MMRQLMRPLARVTEAGASSWFIHISTRIETWTLAAPLQLPRSGTRVLQCADDGA
jgi:hypothetical protein